MCLVSCRNLTKKEHLWSHFGPLSYRSILTECDCKNSFRNTHSSFREGNKNLSENKFEFGVHHWFPMTVRLEDAGQSGYIYSNVPLSLTPEVVEDIE